MCGFIYQQKKKSNFNINSFLFRKASKLIFHRGPDSKSYLQNKNVNVFHSRLKIIDLNQRSNQPMTRNGYTIIFNGEIYNFKELRKELQKNFNFKTYSDTEVLLFSYLKWKEKMFNKINGMFSFVIFNNNKKELFFARDLFGQKPLYFYNDKNQIIFSSEIKPILVLKSFKKIQFEDKEILKYLHHNFYGDTKYTFFKDIFQIEPGRFGFLKKNKLITKKIIYKKTNFTPNIKTVNKIINKEIGEHLVSDVETAIMISEGVDSKSILDISRKVYKKNLKLFNLEFENLDNKKFRKEYYKKKNINLILKKFLKKQMFRNFKYAAEICEAPPLSLFTLGMINLFKKIKDQKIKVVLNGQGVDEIFGGYNLLYIKKKKGNYYHPDGTILSDNKKIFKYESKITSNLSNNLTIKRNYMAFNSKIPKNLNQYDKISMKYSIECRSPYLTKTLANLLNKLRSKDLYNFGHKKYLFRKCLFNQTKDKFYFNPKIFKQAPQTEYMLDKYNLNKIEKLIKKDNLCDKFFIKKNFIRYFDDFKIKKNNGFIIWQYLSLNYFLDYFKKFNS